MPRFQTVQTNITGKTANLLAGDVNEFLTYDAEITVYGVMNAAGIRVSVFADSDLLIDDKEIVSVVAGNSLDTSRDFVDQFQVSSGTRLALFLRDAAGGGATDGAIAIDIQPI